jgi:pectinesterase
MKTFYLSLLLSLFLLSSCQEKSYTIYLAGDSTMANKSESKYPETGWGMALQSSFEDNVKVENHAKNGRSTKSFEAEGRWDTIMSKLQQDDYVFIQFGHNDEKVDREKLYSSPADYYENLNQFVIEVRAKEATPVLLTPIMRRRFDDLGVFYDTHGDYPAMVRKLAEDQKVLLIDLHKLSKELLVNMGEEASKSLFLIADSAVWENFPAGVDDNTHLNNEGAAVIASLVVKSLKSTSLSLKKDLNKNTK